MRSDLLVRIRKYPIRFLVLFTLFLLVVYATLFYFFMLGFEERKLTLLTTIYWTVSNFTTTGEPFLSYSATPLRILSIVVQISGIMIFFAAFPLVILPYLERRLRELPVTLNKKISNQVVICGYNPLVESLVDELSAGDTPFVIIDPEPKIIRHLAQTGLNCLYGEPSDEEVLKKARPEKATTIIANKEDEDNANVVLTASFLTKGQTRIIAVIDSLANTKYFEYAGASTVISPKELLGHYLAKKAITPLKNELFGENELLKGLHVVELPIYPGSNLEGKTIGEAQVRKKTGASIVGIWHRGILELEPGPNSSLSAENVLIAVGSYQQLLKLQILTQAGLKKKTAKKYFVIAGYGDVGRVVTEELKSQNVPHTIIDPLDRKGEYIKGDATDEETLKKAKIEEASTFIVASHIDRNNIFSTLLAREINPHLHILARANSRETTDKLYRAGADFVFSLSAVAGQMLARMIQGEKMITLAEGLKVLTVKVKRPLAKKTIGALRIRSRTGLTIVALQQDSQLIANPGPKTLLNPGATLVVLGSRKQIEIFRKLFL